MAKHKSLFFYCFEIWVLFLFGEETNIHASYPIGVAVDNKTHKCYDNVCKTVWRHSILSDATLNTSFSVEHSLTFCRTKLRTPWKSAPKGVCVPSMPLFTHCAGSSYGTQLLFLLRIYQTHLVLALTLHQEEAVSDGRLPWVLPDGTPTALPSAHDLSAYHSLLKGTCHVIWRGGQCGHYISYLCLILHSKGTGCSAAK